MREIAEQYWRPQGTRNHEHSLLAKTTEILEQGELAACEAWDKLVKRIQQHYDIRHERRFRKCLSTLRTLQKERRAAETEAAAPATQPGQFVSQNSENPSVATEYKAECPSGFPVSNTPLIARPAF